MSEELLLDKFQKLSVSTQLRNPLNSKKYTVSTNIEEFLGFDPSRRCARVLLNYKQLLELKLKAGSLIQLSLNDFLIPNVFEVWPSVIAKPDEIIFGISKLNEWFSLGNTTSILVNIYLIPTENPAQLAKTVKISIDSESTDELVALISHSLSIHSVFFSKSKSFIFKDSSPTFFSIECMEDAESDTIWKFVNDATKITVASPSLKNRQLGENSILLGGLKSQFSFLSGMGNSIFGNSDYIGPRGVLLYGPPGTGKTLLIRKLAQAMSVNVVLLSATDFSSENYGEAEVTLKNKFMYARHTSPCIVFLDEVDALCPKRDGDSSEALKRMCTLLLALMDGFSSSANQNIMFIGATNALNSIDPALRRPGRFDRELEIPPPSRDDRLEILQQILQKYQHNMDPMDLIRISDDCHGFVGADLSLLCKEALLHSLSKTGFSTADVSVSLDDFLAVMTKIRPSAMREVFIEIPKMKWSDIGGQHLTKQKLIETVEWPIKYPERFKRLGVQPPKGVLLFGPPGCSKTLMAKALASESKLNFLAVRGPEIFSKYVGESEKKVRDIFKKARQASPAIIFFDEFDSIAGRSNDSSGSSPVSDRVMSQILNEMDGLEPLVNVIVIAATNKPDLIDKALLRPGRFDRHIYVGPPDFEARLEIFRIVCKKTPFSDDVDFRKFATLTDGFTGAEITSLCQNAALLALERDINAAEVCNEELVSCLDTFVKQVSPENLKIYERFIQ